MRAFILVVLFSGCTQRALELPEDASVQLDLVRPDDLTTLVDAGPPPDLTTPHYCDGIYVISRSALLSFFDPVKLTFTTVAQVQCPSTHLPFSMALGRDGTAWVEYDDGHIFRVDSTTGSCSATSFVTGQHGFTTFGMGFASNSAGSSDETLFVDGDEGRLASVDLTSLALTPITPVMNDPNARAELTGTGTGDLWAFFAEAKPHFGRFDKTTGLLATDVDLPQLGDLSQDGFAFGFFGGSFYAFLDTQAGSDQVVRIVLGTGASDQVLMNTGLEVVGAGVSTCAPTQ